MGCHAQSSRLRVSNSTAKEITMTLMNDKVRSAIQRLSTVSNSAKAIAERLGVTAQISMSADGVADVAELQKQIATLTQQISELRTLINEQDDDDVGTPLSESAQQHFMEVFTTNLGTQSFAVVNQIYDEDYLEAYPANLRYLICTALINWCSARKFDPAPLWYSVMVNNGSM